MVAAQIRKVVLGAFRPNFAAIDWRFALRASCGVGLALFLGLRFGTPLEALAAGMGAVTVGPTSMRGIHRTRAIATIAAAFGMSSAAYIAATAGHWNAAIVVATAGSAYIYGILSGFGEAASAVGLNALIATIILGNIGMPQSQAGYVALAVLGGGLLQALLVVVTWPLGQYGSERRALAFAYRSLADYARHLRDPNALIPAHDALAAAQTALTDPQPFGRRAGLVALQTLADEVVRLRASLALIATSDARNDDTLSGAAIQILDAIATSLERDRPPQDTQAWQRAGERLGDDLAWQRLYGQLRAAWRGAAYDEGVVRPARPSDALLVPHVDDWWQTVRADVKLRTQFGQHALRLALVLGIAIALYRATHFERGYWIALTAAIVLRPDFTTTLTMGIARIAGTIAGGLLAWGISGFVPATPAAHAAAAFAFATFGFVVLRVAPVLYATAITGFVIFLLTMTGLPESGAAVARIGATIIGGVLALIAYRLWPSWQAPLTRNSLAGLIDVLRDYTDTVMAMFAGDRALDMGLLEAKQAAAWDLRTKIATSIERMLGEPRLTHEMTPTRALTIYASTQRFGLGNLALTAILEGGSWKWIPALRAFTAALDAALRDVADSLRSGAPLRDYASPRAAYLVLAHAVAGEDGATAVVAACDVMVDSVNTMADAL